MVWLLEQNLLSVVLHLHMVTGFLFLLHVHSAALLSLQLLAGDFMEQDALNSCFIVPESQNHLNWSTLLSVLLELLLILDYYGTLQIPSMVLWQFQTLLLYSC